MKKSIIINVDEDVYDQIWKMYENFQEWCMNHYDNSPTYDEFIQTLILNGMLDGVTI